MSQQFVPPLQAPLIDGRELRIAEDGVYIDERFHPIGQIEEARMLFLRPETIALRLARIGQVEYSFARPGDGAAALEELYRLRPELHRADAPAPAAEAPAGYFPPVTPPPPPQPMPAPNTPYTSAASQGAPYGAPTRPAHAPPQMIRPMGPVPFPPQTLEAYGPEPNHTRLELTPIPRTAGQLMGAAFRLFGKRLAPLLALALLVATLPSMALAALDALASALSGVNPLAGAPNPLLGLQQALNGQTPTTSATPTVATPLDAFIGLLSLVVVVLTLLVAAWGQAALTTGARQALLGRPISPRACAREGFSRLWPTLWALFFVYGILALIAIPGLGLALTFVLAPYTPGISNQLSGQDAVVFAVIAGVLAAGTLMLVAYLWTRLALYPTAAALGLPQPLRLSLALTSFGWWRVFWALFVVSLATSLLSIPASAAQFLSVALAAIVLGPLVQLVAGPLGALIRVGVLYDQRLRREGYALFVQEGVAPPPNSSTAPAAPEQSSEVSR